MVLFDIMISIEAEQFKGKYLNAQSKKSDKKPRQIIKMIKYTKHLK